mmetsp:Transcript_26991/g.42341  ORF Transcript_26991/g.42341 Transcript_26991/m.42341 type:complete len:226 (+) Transcript_26991:97-774(+)
MTSAQAQPSGGISGNAVCHILPCSIDEDITAPVAQYFHPTPLTTPRNTSTTGDSKNDASDVTIMAAQFRGRGLLCVTDANREGTSNDIVAGKDCIDLTSQELSTTVDEEVNTTNNNASTSSPLVKSYMRPLSKLPSTMVGVVFNNTQSSTTNNNNHNSNDKDPPVQPLTTIEKFSHVYHWRHEHDETKVMREGRIGGSDKEGLNAVLGWCDVAHAVHDSIPLPQK